MDVGVAYREDVDDVMACLRDIDKKMREDDSYKDSILEELEILGVNEFADSAVFIRCRTKTKAHDKWWVGREFNRRMKAAFDEQGIEIPFPHQTLYFGEDKEGKAPAGRLRISRASDSADGASAEEGNGEPSPKKKPDAAEPSGEKKDSAQVKEREGKAE
jgi:moderate conductance mechanosensitive channel